MQWVILRESIHAPKQESGCNQITKKINHKHNELRGKPEEGKKSQRGREKFHYINGDYNRVLWNLGKLEAPFTLEGISYLYKLGQIDKVRKSC